MMETLERLLQFHGLDAKAIVWEHNPHIGDARATDRAEHGMGNAGQLARERFGQNQVVLVGFGSYEETVIAGEAWGAPMERMTVPPFRPGSWEAALHEAGASNKMLIFTEADQESLLAKLRGHRAIGIVYEPGYEHWGNYVPTVLPRRYDAFLYIDRTQGLHPLHQEQRTGGEPPETYPWNM